MTANGYLEIQGHPVCYQMVVETGFIQMNSYLTRKILPTLSYRQNNTTREISTHKNKALGCYLANLDFMRGCASL